MSPARPIAVTALLFAATLALPATSENTEVVDQVPASGEMAFVSGSEGAFTFGNREMEIYAAIGNTKWRKNEPRKWQFRYTPAFIPVEGITVEEAVSGWKVLLSITIWNEEIRERAYREIQKRYLTEASEILSSNIRVFPLRSIRLYLPRRITDLPKVAAVRTVWPSDTPGGTITLDVRTPDKETAEMVRAIIQEDPGLEFSYLFTKKATTQNWRQIKMTDLRNSKLVSELDGLQPDDGKVYVYRDDYRRLCEEIDIEVLIDEWLEEPDRTNLDLIQELQKLVDDLPRSFDETKWKSTYHADDLKPNRITEFLDNSIDKSSGKNHLKWKGHARADTAFGLFKGFIDAKGDFEADFAWDKLKEWAEDHEMRIEWKGEKIEAKDIKVHAVNVAAFDSNTVLTRSQIFARNEWEQPHGTINMAEGAAFLPSLATRLARLEQGDARRAGVIEAFAGPKDKRPAGWLLCDGDVYEKEKYRNLFDAIGTHWGDGSGDGKTFNVPDLRGMFLRGVAHGSENDPGRNERTPSGPEGKSDAVGSKQEYASALPRDPWKAFKTEAETGMHGHGMKASKEHRPDKVIRGVLASGQLSKHWVDVIDKKGGKHEHTISRGGDEETRPRNVYVNWIIKY
ncbi:MAG TPA: tail fiber protein [Candidatus Hydrogenedentes bacterium]|nr:tail fiber protein [Candidatus Hydrogenedentota bacterium]